MLPTVKLPKEVQASIDLRFDLMDSEYLDWNDSYIPDSRIYKDSNSDQSLGFDI